MLNGHIRTSFQEQVFLFFNLHVLRLASHIWERYNPRLKCLSSIF